MLTCAGYFAGSRCGEGLDVCPSLGFDDRGGERFEGL